MTIWPQSYTHAQSDGMFACLLAWARIPLSTEGRTEPSPGAFDAVIQRAREEVCKACPDGIERVVGRAVLAHGRAVELMEVIASNRRRLAWRTEDSGRSVILGVQTLNRAWDLLSAGVKITERWHPTLDWRVDDPPDPGPLGWHRDGR